MEKKKQKKACSAKNVFKLVVVGLNGVGKSCLVIRLISSKFVEDHPPDIEDSYRKRLTIDEHECVLDITDTSTPSLSVTKDE